MKRILIVTTVASTINAFLIPHIKLLKEIGYIVDVASNSNKGITEELSSLINNNYNINFSRNPMTKYNINAYNELKSLLKENEYDVIHTHTPIASFITRLVARKIDGVKIIYTAHGFHFLKDAPIKNWIIFYPLERIAAKWTDILITMNEEDYINAEKMKLRDCGKLYKVNGVGVNLDKFKPTPEKEKKYLREGMGYRQDDYILFYAAELNENKNQRLLIRGVAELKEYIPNIKLLLAGNGPLKEEYIELIRSLNLQNNIELLGKRKDIANLLNISDVVTASSNREGLPVNIMEALSCNIPVVATDIRGHKDLIFEEMLFEKNNVEDFIKKIKEVYNKKEKYSIKNEMYLYSEDYVINEQMKKIYESNI